MLCICRLEELVACSWPRKIGIFPLLTCNRRLVCPANMDISCYWFFFQGGEPDLQTVSKMVLNDWQRGRIPFFVKPPNAEAGPQVRMWCLCLFSHTCFASWTAMSFGQCMSWALPSLVIQVTLTWIWGPGSNAFCRDVWSFYTTSLPVMSAIIL